jgi:hypothetical protein
MAESNELEQESRSGLSDLTVKLAAELKDMLPRDRIAFIDTIMSGYCKQCGWTDPKNNCHH